MQVGCQVEVLSVSNGIGTGRGDWMTVDEVATHLRLSRSKVYEMAQRGEIPCSKIAGRWRFLGSEVDQWMLDLRAPRTGAPARTKSEE